MAIEDVNTIDAVLYDSEMNVVSFVLIHAGKWPNEFLAVKLLKEKLSNYLDFIFNGQYNILYPQYANSTVRFQLEFTQPISLNISSFLESLDAKLEKDYNIIIVINVDQNH